jgi:hypothetical protein
LQEKLAATTSKIKAFARDCAPLLCSDQVCCAWRATDARGGAFALPDYQRRLARLEHVHEPRSMAH